MDIPQEQLSGHPPLDLDWPSQGLIEFQHVTMRYMPSLPAALNDVTFTIPGGMQVMLILCMLSCFFFGKDFVCYLVMPKDYYNLVNVCDGRQCLVRCA